MSLGDDASERGAGLGAVGGLLAFFLVIFVVILVVLVAVPVALWVWLYPLNAAATIVACVVTVLMAMPIARDLSGFNYFLVQIVPPAIATIVVFVWSARLDQRLGEYKVYWALRHLTRLCSLAIGAMLLHYYIQYGRGCFSSACLIESTTAGKGIPVILALVAAVVGHLGLSNRSFREMWHEKLDDFRLRPRDIEGDQGWRPLPHAVGLLLLLVGGSLFALQLPPERLQGHAPWPTTARSLAPSPTASMVLAPVLSEVLGIRPNKPTLDAVRQAVNAQGATISADREIDRFGTRLLLTSGEAAYKISGLEEARFTFTDGMLETVSVSRRVPSSAERVFEQRLRELSAKFHLEKRQGTFAFFRGPGVQVSLSLNRGLITEFYEVVAARRF